MTVLTEEQPKTGQKYVEALRHRLAAAILEEAWQAPDQVTVTVDLNRLPDIVEELYYHQGGWLASVAGNDERPLNGQFAIYYILSVEGDHHDGSAEAEKAYVVVRAEIPPHRPEFPAVTPKVPAAIWYERELRDMFGLQPVGLPDERRLVLPDDWPDELYPLRKDAMDYRFGLSRPQKTRHTSLSMSRERGLSRSHSDHCISPPTSPAISGFMWMESTSSMPIIAFSMSTAAWRNSPRHA